VTQYFFKTAISILVISNHNSFPVLFAKPASEYILFEKNISIFLQWKWPAQGCSTVPVVSAHFRSLFAYVHIRLRYFCAKVVNKLRLRDGVMVMVSCRGGLSVRIG